MSLSIGTSKELTEKKSLFGRFIINLSGAVSGGFTHFGFGAGGSGAIEAGSAGIERSTNLEVILIGSQVELAAEATISLKWIKQDFKANEADSNVASGQNVDGKSVGSGLAGPSGSAPLAPGFHRTQSGTITPGTGPTPAPGYHRTPSGRIGKVPAFKSR